MYFKQWFNCFYRTIGPHREGLWLELEPDKFAEWLGTIDRAVARTLPGAREVPLDFKGWKLGELDRWEWISESVSFVGCLTDLGVFAVLEYQKPLLKRRPGLREGANDLATTP